MPSMLRVSLVAIAIAVPLSAQQVGPNVNVLPVYADAGDEAAYLKGDAYLQRQVEPTIAVSTRNPEHLLAFFNDYRAVDVPDDIGLGGAFNVALSTLSWEPFGLPPSLIADLRELRPWPVAASEAWVGTSRSFDGGGTWTGGMVPGGPFDSSPASLASPVHGLEAATDPVAAAGPCGVVYLTFVAFTRGGESRLSVARYQDRNDDENGDTWDYQGTTVVEVGQNATNGYFLDKPSIAVDVARTSGADPCGHIVYTAYTTFNGLAKDGKFQSKLTLARSVDGGQTWDTGKFNMPYNQNQGTALAVDPRPGTPPEGGGTLYLAWRHFYDPDAVFMVSSSSFGAKFGKPVVVASPLAAYDQPTLATTAMGEETAFRSNGFPTTAVSGDGTVFVAWQERVDRDTGLPDPGGTPRIVAVRSSDGGATWTGAGGGPRHAVDTADRHETLAPDVPLPIGVLAPVRPAGPQVMPRLSFGGGRLLLAYYESRGLLTRLDGVESIQPFDLSPVTGYLSGYDRVFDVRAAFLEPTTGALLASTQVSRYPVRVGADLGDGLTVDDIAPVNPPCSPDFEPPEAGVFYPPCVRQVGRNNAPQSAAGTSPFMGDYLDVTPAIPFVSDGSGWRWASAATDVPGGAFHVAFSDNRHLAPPTDPAGSAEVWRYPFYAPPGGGLSCLNPGSRNTDVFTARVSSGLVVSAPTTAKQTDGLRTFPVTVRNNTDEERYYRLTLTTGADHATFSYSGDPTQDSGEITVFPHASATVVVTVDADAEGPVRVEVAELDAMGGDPVPGGQAGSIAFNADASNPDVGGLPAVETENPMVVNPMVVNPMVVNPMVVNPMVVNPMVVNPMVVNPMVVNPMVVNSTVYDVVDTTWKVTSASATTATYFPVINLDNAAALEGSYRFQLIVTRSSGHGAADPADCEVESVDQDALVTTVANPMVVNPMVVNPMVVNDSPENPMVVNPMVVNPMVVNSCFTVAPADEGALMQALAAAEDETLQAPRPADEVLVTLRAYQVVPDEALGGAVLGVPSLALVGARCDTRDPDANCYAAVGPDLLPADVDTTPLSAPAGGSLVAPAGGWTLLNQGTTTAAAAAGPMVHAFWLSVDEHVGEDDTLLGSEAGPDLLEAGASHLLPEATLVVPAAVAPGDYWLILEADGAHAVSEMDETNNTVAVPLTIVRGYGFLGLLAPWTESPLYTVNVGSAVPLKWHYTDFVSGEILDTPDADPEVRVRGPFDCGGNEHGDELEEVLDPGSSDYRYDPDLMRHQFNWETTGLAAGCYNVRVLSRETGQVDGPFRIGLR